MTGYRDVVFVAALAPLGVASMQAFRSAFTSSIVTEAARLKDVRAFGALSVFMFMVGLVLWVVA